MTAANGHRPQSARSSARWSLVASIALSDSRTIKIRDETGAYCQFDHWDNSFGQFLRIRRDCSRRLSSPMAAPQGTPRARQLNGVRPPRPMGLSQLPVRKPGLFALPFTTPSQRDWGQSHGSYRPRRLQEVVSIL